MYRDQTRGFRIACPALCFEPFRRAQVSVSADVHAYRNVSSAHANAQATQELKIVVGLMHLDMRTALANATIKKQKRMRLAPRAYAIPHSRREKGRCNVPMAMKDNRNAEVALTKLADQPKH